MALNKRKVLDGARKLAQKGAKAKALKEYTKLLQADPRDTKLLLEVGDAYRRWGQPEEAIAQYSRVATKYRQDGFEARAVAVFKQILNLDPKHYSAYASLAELYQRMGLDAEALGALQMAADGYHKEGRKPEALELLRQMAAIDPSNTTSRVKVAELLRQEGMEDEALSEYQAVAKELQHQQDRDQLIRILHRILEMRPDHLDTLCQLVRHLMSAGDLERAEPFAVRALDVSAEPFQYELVIDLYAQMGNDAKLADATRSLARLYRDRGDEDKARELMQRLPTTDVVAPRPRLDLDLSETDEPMLGDDDLLAEEPFLALGHKSERDGASRSGFAAADIEIAAVPEVERPPATSPKAARTEIVPGGDPDQLLAEANVYLRYGKRDQAILSLRAVLDQEPDHLGALEKLGEAHLQAGQSADAAKMWMRAAGRLREAGDADGLEALRARISVLDPILAEQIGPIAGDALDLGDDSISSISNVGMDVTETEESGFSFDLDLDVEIDLDLDQAIEEVASGETGAALPRSSDLAAPIESFYKEKLEIGFDDDSMILDDSDDGGFTFSESDDEDDASIELDIDPEDLIGGTSEDASATEEIEHTIRTAGAAMIGEARVEEEIEEAEFYIAQDMFGEAEAIVQRVLGAVPDHARCLLLMREIVEARGGDAGTTQPGLVSSGLERDAERDAESTARFDEESEDDTLGTEPSAPLKITSQTNLELDLEIDVDLDLDDEDDEAFVEEELAAVATASESLESPADPWMGFDLREALADVLEEDVKSDVHDTSGVLSTVEDGFESIFADFKRGVSATLEAGDYDTRYDLGIAYREMGLFDDAIGEFRVCLESPTRRFDSLYLMGLCARDLMRWEDAVNHLEQALSLPDIPEARLVGVYFDLSVVEERAGDHQRACASMRRVIELDPGFPGATERWTALESGESAPLELGEPGEVYESFDELFDADADDEFGDAAIAETVPSETLAAFVSEAEVADPFEMGSGSDSSNGVSGSVEIEDEIESPDPGESRRASRRKISFV